MIKRLSWLPVLLILPLALVLVLGCAKEFGKIDQGRCVAYDKEKNTFTIIRDKKEDPRAPDYSSLPPHTYTLPEDKHQMGPEPKVGMRMKLDAKKNEIIVFDPATQNFKTIPYKLIDQKENVDRKSPLLLDEGKKPKKFPIVDKDKKTITIYSGRQKLLTTFSVSDADFKPDPVYWDAGDEVRIYYREAGKAQRVMNMTKTDIYKK